MRLRLPAGWSSSISTPIRKSSCATDFAHRRLGFPLAEIEGFLAEAGLVAAQSRRVEPAPGESGKLTVALWLAEDPRIVSDGFQKADTEYA